MGEKTIYDKPVHQLIRDLVPGIGLTLGKVFTRQQVHEWFGNHYPKVKKGTINCHLTRFSTNASSRLQQNAKPGKEDLFFQVDSSRFRLYDPKSDPAPVSETTPNPLVQEEDSFENSTSEFAYEKDLQNYLKQNLHIVEPGLRLYEDDGITGANFCVGGRYIDILAIDDSNNYIVIELKVSRGYDRAIGQILRYMAWIEENHVEPGQSVRGVIIAREISEDLRLACRKAIGVSLFEYKMSVELKSITT